MCWGEFGMLCTHAATLDICSWLRIDGCDVRIDWEQRARHLRYWAAWISLQSGMGCVSVPGRVPFECWEPSEMRKDPSVNGF